MAFIPKPTDNEDENNQPSVGPTNVSGSAATSAQGPNPQQSTSSSGQGKGSSDNSSATSSGSFNNLQNYIKANNGYNASGGGLAGQVKQNLQGQGDDIKNKSNTAYNNFNQQANQNRVQEDDNYHTNVDSAMNDSATYAADQNNVNQYQNYYNAKYTGPNGIENGSQLKNNAQNYQQLTDQTKNENGRFNLLNQLYNRPSYNSGQQSLDNLLLQSNPSQLASLQQARSIGGQVNNAVNSQVNNATTEATNYGNEAAKTQADTKNAFNSNLTNQQTALQDRATAMQGQREGERQSAFDSLQNGTVNADLLQKLGLTGSTNLYGVDASQFLNSDVGKVGIGNVATDADNARFQALSKLSGNNDIAGYATPTGPLGSAINYNGAGLTNATNAAHTQYNDAIKSFYGQLDPVTQASYKPNADPDSLRQTLESEYKNWQAYDAKPAKQKTGNLQALKPIGDSTAAVKQKLDALNALVAKYGGSVDANGKTVYKHI